MVSSIVVTRTKRKLGRILLNISVGKFMKMKPFPRTGPYFELQLIKTSLERLSQVNHTFEMEMDVFIIID